MDYIVKVILIKSTRAFDREYSYIADEEILKYGCGCVVTVPFGKGNRLVDGVVTEILKPEGSNEDIPVWKLKRIHSIVEGNQVLSQEFLELAKMMKDKYICSGGDAFRLLLPPGGKKLSEKSVRTVKLAVPAENVKSAIEQGQIKRIYQIKILEYLIEMGETEVNKVLADFSVTISVLNTLSKHGYVEFSNKVISEEPISKGREVIYPKPKQLTFEQEQIINELKEKIDRGGFSEYLLHGITGSGKTEVYLNLIEKVIHDGGNAIVLVPEISLTPQMTARFIGRFGNRVAVLHSKLTQRERFDQWQLIRKGKVNVVVGARSAIFAPFENLKLVIIDEEHEQTYKSERTPKYHAAEIARFRCKYNKCLMISGSATPSVETFFRAERGDIGYLSLMKRATGGSLPEVKLVDMREELESGNRSVFSRALVDEIEKNLEHSQQTLLLINRRGYSSFLLCRDCGYSPKCDNCNVSMTYHSSIGRVICHYCGYTEKFLKVCPDCKSENIGRFGCGTQKVEDEIKRIFPKASVMRMDMDTTTGRNSHENILKRFIEDKIDILVGTQMIAKGHDMPSVTLVGVIAADSILNMDDFRASEKTFHLICQAAGRAGRGDLPGRVIVQAYNVDDYAINAAALQSYDEFYKREITIRERLLYPPFVNIATGVLAGTKDRKVYDATMFFVSILNKLCENLKNKGVDVSNIDILGPARCPASKVNGKYRWRVIIKSPHEKLLVWLCTNASDIFERERREKGFSSDSLAQVNIDINPLSML